MFTLLSLTRQGKERLGSQFAKLGAIFPTLENDVTLKKQIEAMQSLGYGIEPHQVAPFFSVIRNSNLQIVPISLDRFG